jgi:hypothetical protein
VREPGRQRAVTMTDLVGLGLCRLGFHDWADRDTHQWDWIYDWECARCRIGGGDGTKPPSVWGEFQRQNRVALCRVGLRERP